MFLCNEILDKIILHSCSVLLFQHQYVFPVIGKTKSLLLYYPCWLFKMLQQQQFCSSVAESKTLASEANTELSGPSGLQKTHPRVLQIRLAPRMLYGFVIWVFFWFVCVPNRLNVPLKFADYVQILVTCISSAGPQNRRMEFGNCCHPYSCPVLSQQLC